MRITGLISVFSEIETIIALAKNSTVRAAIIIEAKHECMGCRGVKKSHATMTTSAMRGVFFDKAEARAELMELIKN